MNELSRALWELQGIVGHALPFCPHCHEPDFAAETKVGKRTIETTIVCPKCRKKYIIKFITVTIQGYTTKKRGANHEKRK